MGFMFADLIESELRVKDNLYLAGLDSTEKTKEKTMSTFHAKDGWYFERTEDGVVRVYKRSDTQDGSTIVVYGEFDPDIWASIVASVSSVGDQRFAWDLARTLHMG